MKIQRLSYLRILALAAVMIYHFAPDILPAGFFGVDVLLCLSGFLVTGSVLAEVERTGDFKPGAFLRRRFNRLFPGLIFMMTATLVSTRFVHPDYRTGIDRQIGAALGFVTNYYEILSGGSYEARFIDHVFLHTWSLAVEAHFYIVWGLLLFLFIKVIAATQKQRISPTGKYTGRVKRLRLVAGSVAVLLCAGSFILLRWRLASGADTNRLYFASGTRALPMFAGALLAVLTGVRGTTKRFHRFAGRIPQTVVRILIAFCAALFIIFAVFFSYDDRRTYQFGFLVVSLLAFTALFLLRAWHEKNPRPEPKWVAELADLGYGIYLFHWPAFILFSTAFDRPAAIALTLAVTLVSAWLSFHIWEPLFTGKAFRRGIRFPVARKLAVTICLLLSAAVIALSFVDIPSLTSFERRQWVGALTQDRDQLFQQREQVEARVAELADIARRERLEQEQREAEREALEALNQQRDDEKYQAYLEELERQRREEERRLQEQREAEAAARRKGMTMIGDSVMLGARDRLMSEYANCFVDAHGSRDITAVAQVMRDYIAVDQLKEIVIVGIGTNVNRNYEQAFEDIIDTLPEGYKLIFITPYDGRYPNSSVHAAMIRYEHELASTYPYIHVGDWHIVADANRDILAKNDLVHIGGLQPAIDLYMGVVGDAVNRAEAGPAKGD